MDNVTDALPPGEPVADPVVPEPILVVVGADEALPPVTYFARLADNTVAELIPVAAGHTLADVMHPALAAACIECSDAVRPGWVYDGDVLAPPDNHPVDMQHARVTAMRQVIEYANTITRQITGRYPEAEVASWPLQEAEARSVEAGGGASVAPLLSALAARSGQTLADFAALVLTKAGAYHEIVAAVQAVRSQTEAAIAAASTQDDINQALAAAAGQASQAAAQLGIGGVL